MDWAYERTRLLPKSCVGVVAPWLVMAPPSKAAIRLDLRALDRITIRLADEPDEAGDGSEPHNPPCDVILVCGDLEIALYVADGPEAAARIVQEAAPLTRAATGVASAPDLSELLIIGNEAVFEHGDYIQVGKLAFRTSEVREYALRGANLPLPDGNLIQAALALLVVAAAGRDGTAPK